MRYRPFVLSAFAILLIPLVFLIFTKDTMLDDVKLKLMRLKGLTTIENNPLLKKYDADLKNVKDTQGTESRIDLATLLSGGPPKDGIPSIDSPRFVSAEDSVFHDDDMVIGVQFNGESRAYPYGIMNWHEIVNDRFGDTPITISYCPLCDTQVVFIRKVNDIETTFGVSGKLFNSCLVMYDRLSDSLWVQPWATAVAGDTVNTSLDRIPAYKTTLGKWKKMYPDTKVLSTQTGYDRNYTRYPYGAYNTDMSIIFPVRNQSQLTIHPKTIEQIIFTSDQKTPKDHFSGISAHFTQAEIRDIGEITFDFGGKKVQARWNQDLETIQFFTDKVEIPSHTAFGFVYPAFFE